MEDVGIDVHKRESQICVLTEDGELIERRIRTEVPRFAEVLERAAARAHPDRSWDGERMGCALPRAARP
jgi:transposase